MKCCKCQVEIGEGFSTCPVCGTPIMPTSPLANKVLTIFKDNLFLTLCVLLSVSCGATILGGNGVPITTLLAMIFLWIVYSKARNNIVDVKNMRCVSGVVYAEYVIINVVSILLAVVGIILGVGVGFVDAVAGEVMDAYMNSFHANIGGVPFDLTETFAVGMGWLTAGLFIFVAAILLVVNLFAWKKLHGFVKSVYVAVQNGGATPIVNAKIAKAWLWVFGIFSAVGTLGSFYNPLALLSSGCSTAAYIIGAILVDKYFVEKPVEEIHVNPTEVNE